MKLNFRNDQDAAAAYIYEEERRRTLQSGVADSGSFAIWVFVALSALILGAALLDYLIYQFSEVFPNYLHTLFTNRIPEYFSALFFG